jgi:hypothetical protein
MLDLMPPTYTGAPIASFYAAYWTWFHAHYQIAPLHLYGGAARGPTTDESWGGWQRHAIGVWAGVAFSGNMRHQRVVKVELYTGDICAPNWATVLAAVQAASPAAGPLWAGLQHHVHRHMRASPVAGGPGVYAVRGATGVTGNASTVPAKQGPVPAGPSFGPGPTVAVPHAVSVERGGAAGRVCAFHRDVFDLRDERQVQRMADWMAASLRVYAGALAQLLP